jgi:hypothetical protein
MVHKQTVLASTYGGAIGNRDNNLNDGGYYYAELSVDYKAKDYKALGGQTCFYLICYVLQGTNTCSKYTGLKNGHKLKITYNGKSIEATKGDVGAGGPNHPKIDIHETAAKVLFGDKWRSTLTDVQIEDT